MVPKKKRNDAFFYFQIALLGVKLDWVKVPKVTPSHVLDTTIPNLVLNDYLQNLIKCPKKDVYLATISIFQGQKSEDQVFAKKQSHPSSHKFSSSFQICKCFWHEYLEKGKTRKLEANFSISDLPEISIKFLLIFTFLLAFMGDWSWMGVEKSQRSAKCIYDFQWYLWLLISSFKSERDSKTLPPFPGYLHDHMCQIFLFRTGHCTIKRGRRRCAQSCTKCGFLKFFFKEAYFVT